MIIVNVAKAKVIAHNKRREARAREFKPYDEAIAKQIPGQSEVAEAARVEIRAKYAEMQTEIDLASSVEEIKFALEKA